VVGVLSVPPSTSCEARPSALAAGPREAKLIWIMQGHLQTLTPDASERILLKIECAGRGDLFELASEVLPKILT
jgi:hypothetical protein